MPSCPSCGKEVGFDEAFCRNCGFALKASAEVSAQSPSVQAGGVDTEKLSGLGKLKTSFLLYLIGGAISLVPVVGGFGGLLVFVGFIIFITAWRALGRSSLPSAARYKSTGSWLIYSVIIGIVVGVLGAVALLVILLASILPGLGTGSVDPATLLQSSDFQRFIAGFYAVLSIAGVGLLVAYYKVKSSLVELAKEVSQPRFATAGWLFFLAVVLGFVSLIGISLAMYAGGVSYGSLTYFAYLFALPGGLVQVVAAYFGYNSAKGALAGP